MEPLVSIITPTYNHQDYIAECIQSVLDQTFTRWEMIIIEDGSTDNTLNIAYDFEHRDNRIKVYTQKNIGIFKLAETYNKALGMAKGKYIAILEGDDYWENDKLRLQVELLEGNDEVILCWGQARSISSDKNEIYNIYPDENLKESLFFNNDPVGSVLNMLLYKDWIPALTIIIRANELKKSGGFIQAYNMPTIDLPTLLNLSLWGKFFFISQPLGYWRIYAGQITKIYPALLSEGYFKLVKDFIVTNRDNQIVKTIKIKNIYSFHHDQLIIAYSRSGRYKLIRGQYSGARADYFKSIFRGGFNKPIWKLRSMIGLIFSIFHLNVEGLSALLGKKTYTVS
jgi:glycosyltransferase involved in cell wall biosynthesis